MLHFIKKIFTFFIIAGFSYAALVVVWGFFIPDRISDNLMLPSQGYLFQRLREADSIRDVDILFVGPSTTYRGYDPRIFAAAGLKTFNLGSSAQTPKQTYVLLNQYLKKINPKLVVYDVYPAILKSDGVEPSLDLISNGKLDKSLLELLWIEPNLKLLNALILKSFSQVFNIDSPKLNKDVKGETYIPGGFVEKEIIYNKYEKFELQEWTIREDQLAFLTKNIEMLKEEKFPYLLVRLPIPEKRYKSIENNRFLDSIFTSKGDFINFQNKLKLSDKFDFSDRSHLNRNGVEKFNNELIKYLNKNYPQLKGYPAN